MLETLAEGFSDPVKLTQLGRLGAQVRHPARRRRPSEEFFKRARYERPLPARHSGRRRAAAAADVRGELEILMPRVHSCAQRFAC
jgi:hypothetical protein